MYVNVLEKKKENKMLLRESLTFFFFCAQMHFLLIYGMFILCEAV